MSCNGSKIQTEVPKKPFGDLICPGGALKVDIAICFWFAWTSQTWTRTNNSRDNLQALNDHNYENLTDVPLRRVFFKTSPLWPMGMAKDGLNNISWKPLSQRFINVSLFYSTSKTIGVTAKTSLIASCVKEKLSLQTAVKDLKADCIFQRVCRWPSWDIFVLLGCVQTETQALMGLSKSHEGVFNKKTLLKGTSRIAFRFSSFGFCQRTRSI